VPGSASRWRTDALVSYLNAGFDFGVRGEHVEKWLSDLEPARIALVEALGEGPDPESSSECVLLAIPFMSHRPADIGDIDVIVREFVAAIDAMGRAAREAVAEYGRRWEAIVDTTIPVGQACSIKLSEQRPWLRAPSPIMEQEIAFSDATTTHVEIRAADHGVVIDRPDIRDPLGRRVGLAVADETRETADAVVIYASGTKRPYFARISVRARVRRSHRRMVMWLLALIAAAGAVAVELPEDSNLVNSLVLLIFPLTLAGALALSRAATPLAERLLRWRRLGLMAAIGVLWCITLGRLLLYAEVGWAESAWSAIKYLGW